jgi:hypothetical protein
VRPCALGLALLAVVLSGCGGAQRVATRPPLTHSEQLLKRMLEACHGQMIVDLQTRTCVPRSPASEAALARYAVEHRTPACGTRGHVSRSSGPHASGLGRLAWKLGSFGRTRKIEQHLGLPGSD